MKGDLQAFGSTSWADVLGMDPQLQAGYMYVCWYVSKLSIKQLVKSSMTQYEFGIPRCKRFEICLKEILICGTSSHKLTLPIFQVIRPRTCYLKQIHQIPGEAAQRRLHLLLSCHPDADPLQDFSLLSALEPPSDGGCEDLALEWRTLLACPVCQEGQAKSYARESYVNICICICYVHLCLEAKGHEFQKLRL